MGTYRIDDDQSQVSKRLKKLIDANQSLAEVESLDKLVPRLLDLARDVTAAEASSFLIYDPDKNVLRFASVKDEVVGDKAEEILIDTIELKMGEGIAGLVAEERKPLIIEDASLKKE